MPLPSSMTVQECSPLVTINVGHKIKAMTFTADGEYLLGGGSEDVRVWRVRDGKQMATMAEARGIYCLSVSKDGRWIAAGTGQGSLFVWNAKTYDNVIFHAQLPHNVSGVDFSPDSTRLVTSTERNSAAVWDISTRREARTLHHKGWVIAAKYSPEGDRIVTAIFKKSILIWDSEDGRLLVDVPLHWVIPNYDTGFLWFSNNLLVVSGSKIKQIDAYTGSTVSEWPVFVSEQPSCISLPQHEAFVAYSTSHTVKFWDVSTGMHLDPVQHPESIQSITLSSDGRHLAIASRDKKVTIKRLSHVAEPEIRIDDTALDAWKCGRLEDAEALLTATVSPTQEALHHVLASRALVRAHLRQWDAAVIDAEESIKIQPSVIGYIAKCVALVGNGKAHEGHRACDIAFEHFHSTHVTILLLIKAVVLFMAGDNDDAISRLDNLIAAVQFNSIFCVVKAYMYLSLGNSHMESRHYDFAIQSFEHAQATLGDCTSLPPLVVSLVSGWKFDDLSVTIQQRRCEALYAAGLAKKAGDSLLKMINPTGGGDHVNSWLADFMQQCLSTPESGGHAPDPSPTPLLRTWAKLKLKTGPWQSAIIAAAGFVPPIRVVYWAICEHLESMGRILDAVACFHEMGESVERTEDEQPAWKSEFKYRCWRGLEELGDANIRARQYDKAISHYTAALSLGPPAPQLLFCKRSRAHAGRDAWEDALNDANKAIELDPSFPLGYMRKNKALRGAGHHGVAIEVFETMLSKMSESSDPETRQSLHRYIKPTRVKEAIRATIQNATRESPLVLIDITSGRLRNKAEQAAAFESIPCFAELVSSMTTDIDYTRIEEEVGKYFRYAMFSHKWEDNEPLFEKVAQIAVYDLGESPTHDKLRTFCKIVREAGFKWAWSDTCCINQGDHFVLQEALVSMFKWYEGSAMTIIFLYDVDRRARCGALTRSIWNTRGWTLQEYHASKMVRIYTKDWTPYLGLDIPNHKASPEIISEMEAATGISAQALMALRPGLDDVREKLRLASTRQTARTEDVAYSLLGIFSVSLPILYGEGNKSLGRLLAQLLTSSGDMSILAWTGKSGNFNTCLPASIIVFNQSPTTHIPPPISDVEIDRFHISSRHHMLITQLYDRIHELPIPLFAGRRMKFSCLTFKLGRVVASQNGPEFIFRARTAVLGDVEIRTDEDLAQFGSLFLAHPWIDYLLARHPVGNIGAVPVENTDDQPFLTGELPDRPTMIPPVRRTTTEWLVSQIGRPFGGQDHAPLARVPSLRSPSSISPTEKQDKVQRFAVRLSQPFGALLLTPTRHDTEEYKRVAAESLITVQVGAFTTSALEKMIRDVRTLDVL